MATILNLHGINFSDGSTEDLLVNYFGTMRAYNSGTSGWDNEGVSLDKSYLIDSENFLNHAFFVNGNDSNYSYNSSGTWSTSTNLVNAPIAKYTKAYKEKLYLGNIKINSTWYRSRVWYCDLPKNNAITWGLETGTDLSQTISSAVITSASATFQTNNIKVGDPFFIETGDNAGQYTVRSVDSETQITLTENLSSNASNSTYWVGGNWFDVNTDDGDVITGFGKNSNELLVFKRLSLHRYNVLSGTLRQVKGVPGTGSFRSIIDFNEFTYYYDPSSDAIRRYDGGNSIIITNGIEDIMENITSGNRDNVVGWDINSKEVEFYIGTITTRDGETITNAIVKFDTITETWSMRSTPYVIEAATKWVQSGKPDTYIGTSTGEVLKLNSGYSYGTTPIAFFLEDQPIFPKGSDVLLDFEKLRVFIENGHELQVSYRLWYVTREDGSRYITDWFPLKGRNNSEMVELSIAGAGPTRGCGIQFRFVQSSSHESFLLEKYIIYFSSPGIY